MKISTSKAVLMGFALLTILVLAGRRPNRGSRIRHGVDGPTTTAPAPAPSSTAPASTAPSATAPSDDSTTPPPPKLKATAVASRVVGVRPGWRTPASPVPAISPTMLPSGLTRPIPEKRGDRRQQGRGRRWYRCLRHGRKAHPVQREGEIGNVDLRTGFPGRKGSVVLVGANNRSTNTLELWTLNTKTRQLSSVNARSIKTMASNYGFCLYHSKASDKFYAFVTPEDEGSIQQFELLPRNPG